MLGKRLKVYSAFCCFSTDTFNILMENETAFTDGTLKSNSRMEIAAIRQRTKQHSVTQNKQQLCSSPSAPYITTRCCGKPSILRVVKLVPFLEKRLDELPGNGVTCWRLQLMACHI